MRITRLVCCCGEALGIIFFEGKWCLGNFERMHGPIISHKNFGKVLEKYHELAANSFEKFKACTPKLHG